MLTADHCFVGEALHDVWATKSFASIHSKQCTSLFMHRVPEACVVSLQIRRKLTTLSTGAGTMHAVAANACLFALCR